jgi:hypothetical protein
MTRRGCDGMLTSAIVR